MSKKLCKCGKPATRSTVFHRLTGRKTTDIVLERVCEICYKRYHLGLETFTCKKCHREFYIDLGDFYDDIERFYCPFCRSRVQVTEWKPVLKNK